MTVTWQPWRSAWHEALYGPDGFYRQLAGPGGHFATSAQGIPGGGRLLAKALVALAEGAGCHRVVDVGSGRGELLAEVSAVAPTMQLTGVDIVDRPVDLPQGAEWLVSPGGASLPAALRDLQDTLVVAHEWLDVVPCFVAEHDGTVWRTVEVDAAGAERLATPVTGSDLQWLQRHWVADPAAGERVEVGAARDAAYRELRGRVDSGLLVTVDYGHLRSDRPRWGTLTGYRDGVQCPPHPGGGTDITAHVAMDSLGADELVRQRILFDRLGLRPGAPEHALAGEDPPAYLRALAERSSYAALTAAGGLGDFWWALESVRSQ